MAWRFLMFQKDSALAQWFRARTENARGTRKTMIVALARKLLIALWRLVREGVVPDSSLCGRHNERRSLKDTQQFRPGPSAGDGSPMTAWRWRNPDVFPWLQCRKGEWVRRFGASLPMRMTASWFGSLDPPNTRLWRDRSAPESGLPSDRHPDRTQRCRRARSCQGVAWQRRSLSQGWCDGQP